MCWSFSATCGFKLHPQWLCHAHAAYCGICWFRGILHLQVQKVSLFGREGKLSIINIALCCRWKWSAYRVVVGKSLGSTFRPRKSMRRSRKWSVQSARRTSCPRLSSVTFPHRKNSWRGSRRLGAEVCGEACMTIYHLSLLLPPRIHRNLNCDSLKILLQRKCLNQNWLVKVKICTMELYKNRTSDAVTVLD